MATTPNTFLPSEYSITGTLTMELNYLDNPQDIKISIGTGTTIAVYRKGLIDITDQLTYKTWDLGSLDVITLQTTGRYYIYAQLQKDSEKADLIFSIIELSLSGSALVNGETKEVYNVYLGTISASVSDTEESVPRTWEEELIYGTLETSYSSLRFSPSEYWMSPDAITIELNALDNPEYLQVSVLSGAVIMAYRQDVIGFDAALNFRKWNLQAYNNFFDRTDKALVYARLDKEGSNALIIYSYNILPIQESITDSEGVLKDVYNIYLGTISSSLNNNGESIPRVWSDPFNTGRLNTDQYKQEDQVGEWSKMFRLNKVTDMIEVLKDMTSAVIHKLFIGNKKKLVTDVQTSSMEDSTMEPSDEVIPTTKFLNTTFSDKYIAKYKPDFTNFLVKFFDGVEFGKFVTGMIGGTGGRIDKDGRGEMNSLTLREELIVPKITFNCIDVISGDKANTFAYGTIKNVDKVNMTAELDLLEDERGTLHVNDICRGVFHNIEGGNATEIDTIDDNDFYNYAGFSTSYFTPTKIIENAAGKMKFKYALQVGTTVHPMNGMNFFAYGNFNDNQRQAITYETRYYTRRLKNVNTWKIYPDRNISMQDGLLEGLTIGGMEMHGYGTFQENCYFTGVQIQFTPEQENQFKGEDAYSCNLSTNNAVIKVDRDGNVLSSMVADYNVISGTKNVITGDRNVITNMYAISSLIQAFKGKTELFYTDVYAEGGYTVEINPQNCTAVIDSGVLAIKTIDKESDKAQVDLQINCEGSVILSQSFFITKVMDGVSAYIADFDNNVIPLACNTDGKVLIGLPATTTLSVYQDDKKVAMSSVELDLPDGVQATATNDGVVTVTAVPDTSAENLTVKATAKFIAYGTNYEKSASFSLIKVVQGDTPVIYELKSSANAIVFDNAETYTPANISCVLTKNDGKTITQITTLPEGYTLKYSKDGGSETNYSIGSAVAVSGIEKNIAFKLYKGSTLVDMEDIPLIKDGVSYTGTDEYYQWGKSATVAPTGEWSLNVIPEQPSDTTYRFLWNYEVVKKSDGSTFTTDKHVMSSDGKGIKSIVEYYMLTATPDEPSASSSSWSTDKKVTSSDLPYLWNKEVITFTDDTQKITVRQLAQRGEDGKDGQDGQDGADGADGAPGQDGKDGAQIRYRGDFKYSETYYYDDEFRDIVIYNGGKYLVKNKGSVRYHYPTETSYWEQGSEFSFVAMDTALIDNANIAGFTFTKGGDSNGKPYGTLRSIDVNPDGDPNLYMNTKTGEFRCEKATVRGTINAIRGSFVNGSFENCTAENFTAQGTIQTSNSGDRIIVDASSNAIKMMSGNDLLGTLFFYEYAGYKSAQLLVNNGASGEYSEFRPGEVVVKTKRPGWPIGTISSIECTINDGLLIENLTNGNLVSISETHFRFNINGVDYEGYSGTITPSLDASQRRLYFKNGILYKISS